MDGILSAFTYAEQLPIRIGPLNPSVRNAFSSDVQSPSGPAMNLAVAIYVARLTGVALTPTMLASGVIVACLTTLGTRDRCPAKGNTVHLTMSRL